MDEVGSLCYPEKGPNLTLTERCRHSDFGLAASGTVRDKCCLHSSVCGILLQLLELMRTRVRAWQRSSTHLTGQPAGNLQSLRPWELELANY